jgi:hypothetical protein
MFHKEKLRNLSLYLWENLSVQVYFSKFSPLFPVIHSQTFRPTSENSLLLLSITSIGSLLLGSKSAAAQGTRVFERLNKAILASVCVIES